MKVMFLTMI